jgi:hypothetical protein
MNGKGIFWWRWLVAVTAGVFVLGLGLILVPGLAEEFFALLFYYSPGGISAFGPEATTYIWLAHAVIGATMIGWSVVLLFILLGPFREGSRGAWFAVAASIAAWFVPDTVFSLWSGFWQNAVLNLVLGSLFAVPLAATYRHCHGENG